MSARPSDNTRCMPSEIVLLCSFPCIEFGSSSPGLGGTNMVFLRLMVASFVSREDRRYFAEKLALCLWSVYCCLSAFSYCDSTEFDFPPPHVHARAKSKFPLTRRVTKKNIIWQLCTFVSRPFFCPPTFLRSALTANVYICSAFLPFLSPVFIQTPTELTSTWCR